MKPSEASKKLEFHSKQTCHGCVHPSMVGWCENHCQLPEAFEMAISALEKQKPVKVDSEWDRYYGKNNPCCGACGAYVDEYSKYCKRCGRPIDWSD